MAFIMVKDRRVGIVFGKWVWFKDVIEGISIDNCMVMKIKLLECVFKVRKIMLKLKLR